MALASSGIVPSHEQINRRRAESGVAVTIAYSLAV
jgi:hypothetical protein